MEFKTHCLGSGLVLVSIEGFVTPTFSVGEREREMEGGKRAEAGPSSQTIGGDANQASDPKPVEICTDNDDDGADPPDCGSFGKFIPSPLVPLKDQIEKDKEDESLRRWKEKLLGCVEGDLNGKMEPDVIFRSIGIISDDFGEISTPIPVDESKSDQIHFTLKEGSEYRLKLSFTVLHNIVSGLTYMNTVWKGGLQVDQSKGMLGTFAPQLEPYIHTLDEETTPSGVLARGTYAAKLKFEDDDRRCHMELNYSFEIKKGS